jgi:hypothetical protein
MDGSKVSPFLENPYGILRALAFINSQTAAVICNEQGIMNNE